MILTKSYSKLIMEIVSVISLGLVWTFGKYGSNGELIIAELLLLIFLDNVKLKDTSKSKEEK